MLRICMMNVPSIAAGTVGKSKYDLDWYDVAYWIKTMVWEPWDMAVAAIVAWWLWSKTGLGRFSAPLADLLKPLNSFHAALHRNASSPSFFVFVLFIWIFDFFAESEVQNIRLWTGVPTWNVQQRSLQYSASIDINLWIQWHPPNEVNRNKIAAT